MGDLNERIAVKLFGCHKEVDTEGIDCWYTATGKWLNACFNFQPDKWIAQTFEYVIPEMRRRGLHFRMWVYEDQVLAEFFGSRTGFVEGSVRIFDPTKAAEAIVQAALKAVAAMEQGE